MNKTYLLDYHILTKSGKRLKSNKPARVSNAMSDLHAKIKLETFLKKKHPGFDKLIIDKCVEDYDGSNFIDFFNDITKGNPFG